MHLFNTYSLLNCFNNHSFCTWGCERHCSKENRNHNNKVREMHNEDEKLILSVLLLLGFSDSGMVVMYKALDGNRLHLVCVERVC
jgi:hypothetical protein